MTDRHPTVKQVFTHPVHFLAFGFGSGLAPVAPGTIGTVAAIPIYLLLNTFSQFTYFAAVVIISLLSVLIAGKSAQLLQVHDHGGIVIDEICGYLLTMLLAPPGWWWVITGFILFRFFDIVKPWPIHYLDQHLKGGLGIVVDDLMAGIYALLSLQLVVLAVQ